MLEKSTYYILDAQGQQLSIYEHVVDATEVHYQLAERNLYGSSRLGTVKDPVDVYAPDLLPAYGVFGNRNYELSNHLGNVLAVITDFVAPLDEDLNEEVDGYQVSLAMVADYSPFGVQLDGRTDENTEYRYGFQSQERDDEIKGAGNSVNYKFRMHDPRIGRFFAVDPLASDYPWNSPYAFSENRAIDGVELEGLEFLSSKESMIYMQKGQLFLKLENVSDEARFGASKTKYYAKYPNQSYIGANPAGGRVLMFQYPGEASGPDGSATQQTTAQQLNNRRPMTKQSGGTQFDKRYTTYTHDKTTAGGGRAGLILNAIIIGHQAYKGYSFMFESIALNKQKTEDYDKVIDVLRFGLKNQMIPEKYQNEESFDHLFNTVLFGGDDNTPQELRSIGMNLYNTFIGKSTEKKYIWDMPNSTKEYNTEEQNQIKTDNTAVSPSYFPLKK